MTTTTKDITNFLDVSAIGYNPIRMVALLEKLDCDNLEDLLNAFEDVYASGQDDPNW